MQSHLAASACGRLTAAAAPPFFVSADLWFIDLFLFCLHFTLTDHEQLTSGGLARRKRTTIRSNNNHVIFKMLL